MGLLQLQHHTLGLLWMAAKSYLVDLVDSVYWSVTLKGDAKQNSVKTALEGLQTELREHGTTLPHPLDPHTNTNIAASRRALPAVKVVQLHYKTVNLGKQWKNMYFGVRTLFCHFIIIVISSGIRMYRVFTRHPHLCWVLYIVYISFFNDPGERYYYNPRIIDGETEAQAGYPNCPESYSHNQ